MRNRGAFVFCFVCTTPLLALGAVAGCGGDGTVGFSSSSSSSGGGEAGQGGIAQGGAGGMGTGGTGGSAQGGGPVGECAVAADCDAKLGPAPCGVWACNPQNKACEASAPNCVDADQDGYGYGVSCACAGLDCDDSDANIQSNATITCYSGPAGTAGVGACIAGTSACTNGALGPCVGEVIPSGEACNSEDDDCDGMVDEQLGSFTCGIGACQTTVNACQNGIVGVCVPPAGAAQDGPMCNGIDDDCDGAIDEDCKMCVPVSPNGNDMMADGTFAKPFLTIQAAINWTVANNGPSTVCVASGAACGATAAYQTPSGTTITMANGISVLGKYESTNWTRCTNSTTTIRPQTAAGVTFPAAVQKTTVLDGFTIERFQAQTTAGVTIDGAKNAILSNLAIQNTPTVTNSYGVNVINGADATITKSRIDAGFGTAESIAVRTVGARVTIQDNCASPNAQGRCDDFCANNPSLRGRTQQGTGVTYALLLDNAPGSIVQSSALCATDADQGASIRIAGKADNITIRGNLVNAFGGLQDSHGIWMEDCGGAAPWIVDNHYIASAGDNQQTRVDAIRAVGDCHPVIDGNVQITGGGEGQASNPTGVHCLPNASNTPSKCVVLGNQLIEGSDFGFPPIATGVRCDGKSCIRIERNTITGRGGMTSYGVYLEATGAFVDRNTIRGGCSPNATGIQADNAYSRIQNNFIIGRNNLDCTAGSQPPTPTTSVGLRILLAQSPNELDVHSNTIDAAGINAACTSAAIELGGMNLANNLSAGIFRNNILRAGLCTTTRYNFIELLKAADPRIFEANDLDPTGTPTALYYDEAAIPLTTAAALNALLDMTVSQNISLDPNFLAPPTDLHINPGSPCTNTGTPTGAPTTDYDGQPRNTPPDIGADEL